MNYKKYFPVREYYKKYIIPLDSSKFKETKDKMVCPLHNDHDPSLGTVNSKTEGEICHCFGCNFWGNIIELHQRINRKYYKKYLSDDEAKKDLCRLFNVDYDKLPIEDTSKVLDREIRQDMELNKALERFDIGDFNQLIVEGKRQRKGIAYFNTLMMTMLSEVKATEQEDKEA